MKILDLKRVTIILVTMLLFLSMQISAFASDNCTVVKIPVRQIFDSEVEGIADEFSYIMTTDQSDAPMPAGSCNMQYSWTMEKNAATEIILNVKTAGQYHYNIYQTTEKKDDYKYDQNRYYVTVEAYYNESNQLKVVTIVANEKGEKIEAISFKNSYIGEEKPNPTQPSNPSQPSGPSNSDESGKINSVKTGDDSPVMGYFLLLFGSLICLSVLIHKSRKEIRENHKMRHNIWKKYLKILCSWILILSICFLSLNVVVEASDTDREMKPVSEQQSETEETIDIGEQSETEDSADQITDLNAPEQMSVQSLEEELLAVAENGEEASTNRVEYVDVNGNPITGAPSVIQFGAIADHKELSIEGRHFEFKSAKVDGKNCVYIGKYNGTIYYSTDGVIAIKMDDTQKLTMMYQEYHLVSIKEVVPDSCTPGTNRQKKVAA